jgi:hypothetical protein
MHMPKKIPTNILEKKTPYFSNDSALEIPKQDKDKAPYTPPPPHRQHHGNW